MPKQKLPELNPENFPTVLVSISELHSSPKNPRKITPKNLERLAAKIKRNPKFLLANPIKFAVEKGQKFILAGDKRTAACRMLGLEKIPAIDLSELTPEQRDEFMVTDNVHDGTFDDEVLKLNFNEEMLKAIGDFSFLDDEPAEEKPEEVPVLPYIKTHVLISFHPDQSGEVLEHIEKIQAISGVEITQASET